MNIFNKQQPETEKLQTEFTAVVEKDLSTGLYVGHIPGYVGAHSQGETMDELLQNLKEVLNLVLEDDQRTAPESEFVGTQLVTA